MTFPLTNGRRAPRLLLAVLCILGIQASAAADALHPYEAESSGYFRDRDTLPGAFRIYQQEQEGRLWGLGPGGGAVRRSSFNADAHAGIEGYGWRSCVSCHEGQRNSLHSDRGNVSCEQCHRGQPIAGTYHYYSPMNPIRRHAYVCAKCHEGASASFATYVVHEPPPLAASTRDAFPLFYYGVWFMVILAGGVFLIFVPYVTLWGIRELVGLFKGDKGHV